MDDLLKVQIEEMDFPDLQVWLSESCDIQTLSHLIEDAEAETQRRQHLEGSVEDNIIDTEEPKMRDATNVVEAREMRSNIEMSQQCEINDESTNIVPSDVGPDFQTLLTNECDIDLLIPLNAEIDAVKTQQGQYLTGSVEEKSIETEVLETHNVSNQIEVGEMGANIIGSQQLGTNFETANNGPSAISELIASSDIQMSNTIKDDIDPLKSLIAEVEALETQQVQNLTGSNEVKLVCSESLGTHSVLNENEACKMGANIEMGSQCPTIDGSTINGQFAVEHMKLLHNCIASQNAQLAMYHNALVSAQRQLEEKDQLMSQLADKNKADFESQMSETNNQNIALQTKVEALESDNTQITKQFQKCREDLQNTNIRYENLKAKYEQALRSKVIEEQTIKQNDAVMVSSLHRLACLWR